MRPNNWTIYFPPKNLFYLFDFSAPLTLKYINFIIHNWERDAIRTNDAECRDKEPYNFVKVFKIMYPVGR